MPKFVLIFFLFLQVSHSQINLNQLDSLAHITLSKTQTTGAIISVVHGKKTLYTQSYGYNNKHKETVLTDSTLFPISSNTKAFNAILLSQQVEKGQLSFINPIKNYLPNFNLGDSYISSNTTLLDLLTHRVGLPRYDFVYYGLSSFEQKEANKVVTQKIGQLKTTAPFRTTFKYGNNQYVIAAHLLEQITKEKWERLLSINILKPLNMLDTHCNFKNFKSNKYRAIGYQKGETINVDIAQPLYWVSGMGNMFSTVRDMQKWLQFLLNGKRLVLSKKWLNYNLSAHFNVGYEEPFSGFSPINYGLGWYIFEYMGHKVVLHHGDNIGHQSILVLLPDDNMGWVIMVNEGMAANSFPFRMTFALLDQVTDTKPRDWNSLLQRNEPIVIPDSTIIPKNKNAPLPSQFSLYTGTYRHVQFGNAKILLKREKLILNTIGLEIELTPWAKDCFKGFIPEFETEFFVRFEIGNERVTGFNTNLAEPEVGFVPYLKVK